MDIGFDLPCVDGASGRPIWTGHGFEVDGRLQPVLAYGGGDDSGWSDDLAVLQDVSGGQHFMEVATRTRTINELKRHLPNPAPVIMEIGCSAGYCLQALSSAFPRARLIGADYPLPSIARLAEKQTDIPLIQFDLSRCPLPDDCCDAVVLLQVLEHIENDGAAMGHLFRIVKPGGIVIIEVPAAPHLYDAFDEYAGHFRRYDMASLEKLARSAGFSTVDRSHLGFLLYPAFWITKRLNQWRAPKTKEAREEMVRSLIVSSMRPGSIGGRLMALEEWLRRRVYLPVGMRCLLTVRKPANP